MPTRPGDGDQLDTLRETAIQHLTSVKYRRARRLVERILRPGRADVEEEISETSVSRRRSQATELVDLATTSDVELWHTPAGDAYGTVRVDGHREHHPLRRLVRDYLARAYYKATSRTASAQALTDATGTLAGMARYDGAERGVHVRVATEGDTMYLDMGDRTWRSVAIDRDGWRIELEAPVRHWRPPTLGALPTPVPGGTLDALRDLWPALDDDTWTLSSSWVVAALEPRGPYPTAVLTGEQGAGKSTFGQMLRGLIDPASPMLRGVPRDERDVMIGAITSYVVALDNLSGLPVWLSDALCRIATGGGLATRTLYSDLEETTIEVCRPILLTGIDSPATRGDLVDRALLVTLPTLSDDARTTERELWARYETIRPALLGALLDAVSGALRRRADVRLDRRPRMADACEWVTAAEPTLGWREGRTFQAWNGARAAASADLIATDPIASAILELTLPWTGTATALLTRLSDQVPERTRAARDWPASPRSLSGRLRRLAPDLRRAELDVKLPTDARTARERIIEIRKARGEQDRQDRQDTASVDRPDADDPSRPVGPEDSTTGQSIGQSQDADSARDQADPSCVSGLSCPLHPRSGVPPSRDPEVPHGRQRVW